MLASFITEISLEFQKQDYLPQPLLEGVSGLLYLRSKTRQTGFSKVENHFLFVDWENAMFSYLNELLETYQKFSKAVNQSYPVPRAFRLHFPNLAVIAVSENDFPPDAVSQAQSVYLNPLVGGETGQIMLINCSTGQLIHHSTPYYRQSGSIPLQVAVNDLKIVVKRIKQSN
jgi:hypothetical protein